MNEKKLAYDSDSVPGVEKLTYRLRLWTDPAGNAPPVIMASERKGWDQKSVLNASESIYRQFANLNKLKLAYSQDRSSINTIAKFSLAEIVTKINFKIQSSLGNAGSMTDITTTADWLGKKAIPELIKLKSAINEYTKSIKQLNFAYSDVIFVEHFIGREAAYDEANDALNLEKFYVTSYKTGSRQDVRIIGDHKLMLKLYGIDDI